MSFFFCFVFLFDSYFNSITDQLKKKAPNQGFITVEAQPHFSRSRSRRRWPPDDDHHGLQINLVISLCFGFQICFWISYLIVWFVSRHPRAPL
ncbi:hypothetical protein AAZV13_13G250200 [Glycine max]